MHINHKPVASKPDYKLRTLRGHVLQLPGMKYAEYTGTRTADIYYL